MKREWYVCMYDLKFLLISNKYGSVSALKQ
jgi:hypothetical protein